MNEERLQAYFNLINALLTCPNGEEAQVLNDNWNLVDAGLVQTMAQVAKGLAEAGDIYVANFLINLACQLSNILGWSSSTRTSLPSSNLNSQIIFLMQILQATQDSKGNPQGVYPLLEANIDKLDNNFATVLRNWATDILAKVESRQAHDIAAVIVNFSRVIQEFSLVNTNILEITITCYEVVAHVLTPEIFPSQWRKIQKNLLIQIIRATQDSNSNSQVVYRLLKANLNKLDNYFAQLLRESIKTI